MLIIVDTHGQLKQLDLVKKSHTINEKEDLIWNDLSNHKIKFFLSLFIQFLVFCVLFVTDAKLSVIEFWYAFLAFIIVLISPFSNHEAMISVLLSVPNDQLCYEINSFSKFI